MLTGMYPATSGDAIMGNKRLSSDLDSIRNCIGFCPQHDILFDELTVEEHLILFANIKQMDPSIINGSVDEIMTDVGLNDKRYAKTKTLSGGQKRKLSVAIALLGDSKIVYLGLIYIF